MQTAVLVVADGIALRGALTYFSPKPVLLMQAAFVILLLAMVIAISMTGEPLSSWNVGLGSLGIGLTYIAGMYIAHKYEQREAWKPVNVPENPAETAERRKSSENAHTELTTRRMAIRFSLASIVVLAAGWLVTNIVDALGEQTGIGTSFIGATLLAIVTSLPELSTTIQAARIGNFEMAISNVFGSNAFDIALLLLSDICYRSGPVLAESSASTGFIAAASIILTTVYLYGMLERHNRTVLRVGWDSAVVAIVYVGSLWVLYGLK